MSPTRITTQAGLGRTFVGEDICCFFFSKKPFLVRVMKTTRIVGPDNARFPTRNC